MVPRRAGQGRMTNAAEIARPERLTASWPLPGGALFTSLIFLVASITIVVGYRFAPEMFRLPQNRTEAPIAEDLAAFHRAGEMARSGAAADAYDPTVFRAGLAPHQQGLLWLNPPHAFLLMAPVTAAPYGATKLLWLIALVGCFVGVLRIAGARARAFIPFALLSPALLIAAALLQLGPFIALGLSAALLMAPTRPILAGALLALLTMKPQYGLMAPLFLAATGQWRAIVAAAAFTCVLVALSCAFFGYETWVAFFESIPAVHAPFAQQVFEGSVTLSHTAAKLGAADWLRSAVQVAGVLVAGAIVVRAARTLPRRPAIGLTLLFSLAAAPSAWIYDWPLVVAALGFLISKNAWPLTVQAAAGAAWAAPLVCYFADTAWTGLASPLSLYALCAAATAWLFGTRREKLTPPIALEAPQLVVAEKADS
ncbi:MAG: glycosyltransferase family 87 protein [Parvularculaceae bacterium]